MTTADLKEGIYISQEGLAHVREIFSAVSEGDTVRIAQIQENTRQNLLAKEWTDSFDPVYEGLYALTLLNLGEMNAKTLPATGSSVPRALLDVTMPVSFSAERDGQGFTKTLLPETEVASLIRLHARIRDLVPYTTVLSALELNRKGLKQTFTIMALPPADGEGLIPRGMEPGSIFTFPGWTRIKKAYSLPDDGLTLSPFAR